MKWAILLCGLVATWLVNAWYYMVFIGIAHSWWPLIPVMGFHLALLISALVLAAIVVGRAIGGLTSGIIKELK